MISTNRGQRPVAGPISAGVIRPRPQAIIGMSSHVEVLAQLARALGPLDELVGELGEADRQRRLVHDLGA